MQLIERFYDCESGQVLVDGIDVRNYDLNDLREHIGYVG
jgi:ABC-type multidrug transport system fused ATPase/permease subunit